MARIRTIKPEFFTSEDIVALSPLARLLYVALWCEADREGRMAWKPRTFKMRYLPADDCDVEALCAEVVAAGLVRLYGDGLAHIPKFSAHQHVNPREAASSLPAPDAKATRAPRVSDASARDSDAQVGKEGKEGKGKEQKEGEARKRAAPAVLVSVSDMEAEGVNAQHATDWLVARKAKDLPLTPTAWEKTKAEAIKAGMTIGAAIQTAAANGWAGFKASWLAQAEAPRGQAPAAITTPTTDRRADSFLAEQDERAAMATKPPAAILALAGKAVERAA
jgi:hypothetical protein